MIRVIRKNLLTGKDNHMDLPVTEEELKYWEEGALVQQAMPQLNNVQREFLITGMSEQEQRNFFKEVKDDE